MLVLLSFQIIVHTTLCLCVAIILPSYPHLHQSMLDDTLILSVFALCGTKYQSVFWELRAVLFLATLFTDISVVICCCCFVDVIIIVVDLFCKCYFVCVLFSGCMCFVLGQYLVHVGLPFVPFLPLW